MINSNDMFVVKVAQVVDKAEEKRKMLNLHKAFMSTQPKTREEAQAEALAGKAHTAGQVARGGLIGAGVGAVADATRGFVAGGKKGLVGSIKRPKNMLGSAVTGAMFGSIVPALKRQADLNAAESGWY